MAVQHLAGTGIEDKRGPRLPDVRNEGQNDGAQQERNQAGPPIAQTTPWFSRGVKHAPCCRETATDAKVAKPHSTQNLGCFGFPRIGIHGFYVDFQPYAQPVAVIRTFHGRQCSLLTAAQNA